MIRFGATRCQGMEAEQTEDGRRRDERQSTINDEREEKHKRGHDEERERGMEEKATESKGERRTAPE